MSNYILVKLKISEILIVDLFVGIKTYYNSPAVINLLKHNEIRSRHLVNVYLDTI